VASAETDEERRERMNRRMDESLGDFDTMIRKERERIARERDQRSAEQASSGQAAGEGGEGGGADGGTAGGDMKSSTEDQQQDQSGEAASQPAPGGMKSEGASGSGASPGGKALPTPANVPSGDDDDIIARQIREAAEKETDPELREKLWQEYIEYKRNAKK
jgi:hypothetical protein